MNWRPITLIAALLTFSVSGNVSADPRVDSMNQVARQIAEQREREIEAEYFRLKPNQPRTSPKSAEDMAKEKAAAFATYKVSPRPQPTSSTCFQLAWDGAARAIQDQCSRDLRLSPQQWQAQENERIAAEKERMWQAEQPARRRVERHFEINRMAAEIESIKREAAKTPQQKAAEKSAEEEAAKKAEAAKRAKAAEAAMSREKAEALAKINVPRNVNPYPCRSGDWSLQGMGSCMNRENWEKQEDARVATAKERIYKIQKNAARMTKRKLGWDNGSFAPINQQAVVASAGAWGTSAECPSINGRRGVVMAACGSGSNADCQGHPVQTGCAYYTAQRRIATTNAPERHGKLTASRWGERLVCPDGQAIVSICGSGSNPNCNGRPSHIDCASLTTAGEIDPNVEVSFAIHAAESQWIPQTNWGTGISCPLGMVATGFCGSGGNPDCNGNVIELRCSAVYAYETPLN